MVARLLDMVVQIVALLITLGVILAASRGVNTAALAAMLTVTVALIIVGYPTIFETLSRGKTLGKMAMGLRVVSDDGGPVRFRQALIRALAGIFEIWSILLCPVALLTSMASARGKRLGDIFAGTYVILERVPARANLAPEFAAVPAPLMAWAAALELSGLSDQDADAAGSFLRRYYELEPPARDALGVQLATAVAARVSPPPPPGTPPATYLAAVLAVRRHRELARLAADRPRQAASGQLGPEATRPMTPLPVQAVTGNGESASLEPGQPRHAPPG